MDTSKLQVIYEYEKNNLNSLCEKWQKVLDNGARRNSQNEGAILATLGQSRLLLNKKLKQFEQLLTDAGGLGGDMPPITLSDLEGFWEVVMIQMNDVYAKFDELEQLNILGNESSKPRKTTEVRAQRPNKYGGK